jgi:hypothetical protein
LEITAQVNPWRCNRVDLPGLRLRHNLAAGQSLKNRSPVGTDLLNN